MLRSLCLASLLIFPACLSSGSGATPLACPVTLPPEGPNGPQMLRGASVNGHILWVSLFGRDGTVLFRKGGPGFILPNGSLQMKFLWAKGGGLRGALTVHGKRLDAPAPALSADIDNEYVNQDYQPSYLIFPTAGCWQVTGEVADARVTFVTRVIRVPAP
jgi:hypothetical protein